MDTNNKCSVSGRNIHCGTFAHTCPATIELKNPVPNPPSSSNLLMAPTNYNKTMKDGSARCFRTKGKWRCVCEYSYLVDVYSTGVINNYQECTANKNVITCPD